MLQMHVSGLWEEGVSSWNKHHTEPPWAPGGSNLAVL